MEMSSILLPRGYKYDSLDDVWSKVSGYKLASVIPIGRIQHIRFYPDLRKSAIILIKVEKQDNPSLVEEAAMTLALDLIDTLWNKF